MEAMSYTLNDQHKHLGKPPWKNGLAVEGWEEAHGHDVRLKCLPEYGCQVIYDEYERLLDENERLRDAIHKHEEAVGSQDDLPAEVVVINRDLWSAIR